MREEFGLSDERTLSKVFDLLDVWIGLYRLDETDALLKVCVDVLMC